MLELQFGVQDLARTRFSVSPLDQILGGVAGVDHPCVGASVRRDRWWRRVRRQVPQQAAPLLNLVNANFEGIPEFLALDIEAGRRQLADELDALVATPEGTLRQDLAFYGDGPDLAPIVRELRDGGSRQLCRIADGVWALFRACLAPDWPDIQRLLQADIAIRSQSTAEAGIGPMLESLHPQMAWQANGVLRIPAHGWNHGFHLDGRGLELRPNLFLRGISAMPAERRSAMMMYPVRVRPPEPPKAHRADGLALLMGEGRARALRSIGRGPCTTTQLGERLGLGSPTASAHATALRAAGAITTDREGRQVRHALTQLGRDLLLSNPEAPDFLGSA